MTGGLATGPLAFDKRAGQHFAEQTKAADEFAAQFQVRFAGWFHNDMHNSVIKAEKQVPSEIRKNDVNLQAQLQPLPIFGLASDLTSTLRNHWGVGGRWGRCRALPKFTALAGVSSCARRTAEGGCPPMGIFLNRKHLASTVQRCLSRAGQDEDKQGILEILNLEDHVPFAPSRLRDREGIFSVPVSTGVPETVRFVLGHRVAGHFRNAHPDELSFDHVHPQSHEEWLQPDNRSQPGRMTGADYVWSQWRQIEVQSSTKTEAGASHPKPRIV